ncbi:hypothetical protein [Lactiplantibacillus paraxiangfangensis]|uniref:hypothetical protein n=1 Tax=Lactiplantibacillus paraxiangfangensis TaxID=3076224 RepID=UPI0030C67778
MIKQSDLALAAWKTTERILDAVVTINKIDYKTTDIVSISYDAGGYTGDTFGIGSNYENSIAIKFSHLVEGLKPGMATVAKIGVKTSSGYEYSSLGVFIVSDDIQMDRNNDETTIKAYDQMCLLEGNYVSKLAYPAKMVNVIAEIANLSGVPLNTEDISRLPVQADLPSAITGQTYRNAIGMIAQFYAGFVTFDREGKLTIRTIAEPDYTLDPSQYEQGGLTKNEAPYTIGGIQCEVTTSTNDSTGQSSEITSTLQAGSTSGSQIKLTNNLMTADRLQVIWSQIKSVNFYPFSLNWFGNPAIEAGDWLTLQDTKGNKFNVPNNGYTLTFDGSLSAVSKADQTSTSSSNYAWRGQLSQTIADLGGRQGASGNYIYGTDTTEPPYTAKFNDIWYKQNGNKVELWTYERQSDGTGKWMLTVSDSTGEEVRAKVDAASQESAEAVVAANNAVATANTIADTAGFAKDTALKAHADAGTAMTNALQALNDANGLVDKVTTNTADIDKTAKSLLLKANQTDVDAVAGRVTTAEGSLKVMNDQVAQTVSHSELTSQLNGYATQSWTQGQISTTASSITSTVSSVQSQVNSSAVGTNLLHNTNPNNKNMMNPIYQPNATNWAITSGGDGVGSFVPIEGMLADYGFQILNNSNGNRDFKQYFDYVNREYVFSVYAKPAGENSVTALLRIWDGNDGISVNWVSQVIDKTSGWTRLILKVDAEKYALNHKIAIQFGIGGPGGIVYACPKLEVGSVATDFCINPSDNATTTALSSIEQTVKGVEVTVSDPVNGVVAKQSLLANQYTSLIGGLGQKNLIYNSEFENSMEGWSHDTFYNTNQAWASINGSFGVAINFTDSSNSLYKIMSSKRVPVGDDLSIPYSASISMNINHAVKGFFNISFFDANGTRVGYKEQNAVLGGGKLQLYKIEGVIPPSSAKTVCMQFGSQGTSHSAWVQPMLVQSATVGLYQQDNVSSSQITQMQDAINLRVTKGSLMSQINVDAGHTLIQSNKIFMDASSVVFSGQAFIPAAAITSLSADKITTGTLNGQNVNVTNLNASHITTGTLTGSNLQINLNTGEVSFQKGRIHSLSNNIDINVDAGYMSVANGDTRIMMKNGEMQFVEPKLFDTESSPYLRISNSVSGASFAGASFVGRDYAVLANSANDGSIFSSPLGMEKFSGISTGQGLGGWQPTKIGGAERGVFISGGQVTTWDKYGVNDSSYIFIGSNDGIHGFGSRIYMNADYVHIKSASVRTTSSSPNLVVADDGALVRSTSASKYKVNISRNYSTDYGEKLLEVPTATWMDKASIARYNDDPSQPVPKLNYGMIAEDLAAAGLEHLVVRNQQGGLEGIQYDRIAVALLPLIKQQQEEIDKLKQKLEAS